MARLVPARSRRRSTPVELCKWQIATASASATSCGDGGRVEPEQQLHHLLHLRLLGAAVADDRALDLRRRVLDDRAARFRRPPAARRRARARASARCARCLAWKMFSTATQSGRHSASSATQAGVNVLQRSGKVARAGAASAPQIDETVAAAGPLDAAVSRALGAGIDPEDLHANEASISFSSMSAFDHTFLVSS